MEKKRKTDKIDAVDELKNASLKKNAAITAKKIVEKYKSMKRSKKTYLIDEKDLENPDYNEPQEDLFKGESIINAVNKVFNFEKFKKDQSEALKKPTSTLKKSTIQTAKKISKKYKNLKKPKKTYLVNEEYLETIAYDETQEDLFKNESILNAANKVFDFNKCKKEQNELINKYNKRKTFEDLQLAEIIKVPKKRKVQRGKLAQIAADKIRKKYKNIGFR